MSYQTGAVSKVILMNILTSINMRYLVTDTIDNYTRLQVARGISRALYKISRPDTVVHPDDVTKYNNSIVSHPQYGTYFAVVIDEAEEIKKHADANPDDFYIFIKHLTDDEKQQIKQFYINNDRIPVKALIEQFGTLKSYTEMETDGWFNYPYIS